MDKPDAAKAEQIAQLCANCGHTRGNHRRFAGGVRWRCYYWMGATNCDCKDFRAIDTSKPAPTEITDEMVERGAKAAFEHVRNDYPSNSWYDESEIVRKRYRKIARVALEAGLNTGD